MTATLPPAATPASAAPPPPAMPTWADNILAAALMGVGAKLVSGHVLTAPQLQDGVAAVCTLVGLAYAAINANPNKTSPVAMLLKLVRAAPPASRASYDAALAPAEAAIAAKADTLIAPQASKIPLVGGIVAKAAESAAAKAIQAEGRRLKV